MNDNEVAVTLKRLRERAGMSMADVAKALGLRGSSSYQRYEDPALFRKPVLPVPMVKALEAVFCARGVTAEEVWALAGVEPPRDHPTTRLVLTPAPHRPELERLLSTFHRPASETPTPSALSTAGIPVGWLCPICKAVNAPHITRCGNEH